MKRRRNFEAAANPRSFEYSAVEICEEESNDDNQFKSNLFLPMQALYSLIADNLKNRVKKIAPFSGLANHNPVHRYLTFQVFRI